jgi:peroxiredoxin 5
MAPTAVLRRLALNASRTSRAFHSSSRVFIKVGDKIPNLDVLVESSPGNKVNLSEAITGKALIIGVPAAFSKSCSHLTLMIDQWRLAVPAAVLISRC